MLNVYFRDVQHFVGIVLQALFYSAPIVYPLSLVPKHKESLGVTHPACGRSTSSTRSSRFVERYRAVLYDLRFPSLGRLRVPRSCGRSRCSRVGLVGLLELEPRLAEEV